jgi:hypothetical protein
MMKQSEGEMKRSRKDAGKKEEGKEYKRRR